MIFYRRDPAKNVRRFWRSIVTPTLWGGWSLIREWGRIGQPGTVKARSYASEADARRAEQRGIKKRQRNGYTLDLDMVAKRGAALAAGGSIHAPKPARKSKSKTARYLDKETQGVFDFARTSKDLT
jgi:predicted DNA-binding WGR domain protein